MKPSIAFYTFGCRLNQSETAVIQRTFAQDGYRIVDFEQEPADVVVVNTCTVTENGDTDARRLVHKINRQHPQARIALIGCQAQIQKEKLTQLPHVSWVIGSAAKMDLKAIIEDNPPCGNDPALNSAPAVIVPPIPKTPFTMPAAGIDPRHTRANIKIQDGCDFFCSFCEIPYARGRARSRIFEDILKEAGILAEAGHQELVITGINVGTYQNQGRTILDVIDALEQIPALRRIRISSIEPTTIPQGLFARMTKRTKLCRHLHIPLQSASNPILTAMKRKYTFEEFRDFVQAAKNAVPRICVGTDMIVGFPGETEERFQETVERVRALPIDYIHVFSYSPRRLANSRHLKEMPAPSFIQRRSRALRALSHHKRRRFHASLRGAAHEVLFEKKEKDEWEGTTDNYARIRIKSTRNLRRTIARVLLERRRGQYLTGRFV